MSGLLIVKNINENMRICREYVFKDVCVTVLRTSWSQEPPSILLHLYLPQPYSTRSQEPPSILLLLYQPQPYSTKLYLRLVIVSSRRIKLKLLLAPLYIQTYLLHLLLCLVQLLLLPNSIPVHFRIPCQLPYVLLGLNMQYSKLLNLLRPSLINRTALLKLLRPSVLNSTALPTHLRPSLNSTALQTHLSPFLLNSTALLKLLRPSLLNSTALPTHLRPFLLNSTALLNLAPPNH